MTNFERLKPHIEALFGTGWTPKEFAQFYADAMGAEDCTGCIVGLTECTHRMGQQTWEEFKHEGMTEEEEEAWFDDMGNGKVCDEVLLEYLNEETKDEL